MNPSNPAAPGSATEKDARSLLEQYRCPTPFHVVRSRFMGEIATPRPDVSPMGALAHIWGGELPQLASHDDLEKMISVLMQGLWNRLADHQKSVNPFRLSRFEVLPTRQGLHGLALLRAQELDGFVDGLFGPEDEMMLPQKAHDAVQALSEVRSIFSGAADLLADDEKPASEHELKALLRNFQQMTIAADALINKAVQSCKRFRSQDREAMDAVSSKRTLPSERSEPASDLTDPGDGQKPAYIDSSIDSSLSQKVTRNGVTARIEIYGSSEEGWILEIVDSDETSHVWDDPFETEQQALAEALRALDEEALEFWGAAADHPLS